MTKLLVIPNDINNIDNLINNGDGFILGIDRMNQFFSHGSFSDLKSIIIDLKNKDKEIFISMNKIMHNKDLKELEELLIELDKLKVNGILYGDLGVVSIWKRLGLKVSLVWDQTHIVTNYHTCNYWFKKSIKLGNIAGEVTMDEIIDIKNNTDMKLMAQVFGFLPIFSSVRKLISNYFDYLDKDKKDTNYFLYDKERKLNYPIKEINGTSIYSGNILNGINEVSKLIDNKIDYVIVNGVNLNDDVFNYVADSFYKVKTDNSLNVNKLYEDINNKLPFPNDRGFFYKQTIYKVREHE
ncbi:MAG: U32 family peptidase [Bacilli bacterium]